MKISIITICFNSEDTIEDTIKSIEKQDYKEIEYIIIDGKSTDRTIEIIKKYPNIKLISEKDNGISDAFNKGIKLATGEIIGIINSDDILEPNALKFVEKCFDNKTDVLFGNVIFFGEKIEPYINKSNPDIKKLYDYMSIMHPAVFVKKSAYDKYGNFDESLKSAMDRELLLRMYSKGANFKYVNTVLARFRIGGFSNNVALKYTIPENERISIEFGKSRLKARIFSYKCIINYKISTCLNKNKVIDKLVRKLIKKERKYISYEK